MSCSYADGLSPYTNKGKLGLDEKFDNEEVVADKIAILAEWINEAKHVVVHTGAGISTAAGIPDFRGPKGVWTLEAKGLKPEINVSFNDAVPTKTHMAIVELIKAGKIHYVVSQNIDGLHLRSGLPRTHLAELHGNMFVEQCNQCSRQFVREKATTSVGQKCLNQSCPAARPGGRPCRGRVHDTILDWEHDLPIKDLHMADFNSCVADLSICLGTTLQIIPSGNLPLNTRKYGGRLVICNLQPTKHDRKADLVIHSYVDGILEHLTKLLDVEIPPYKSENDPSKNISSTKECFIEWTIKDKAIQHMRKWYLAQCCGPNSRKRIKRETKDNVKSEIKEEEGESKKKLRLIEVEEETRNSNAASVEVKVELQSSTTGEGMKNDACVSDSVVRNINGLSVGVNEESSSNEDGEVSGSEIISDIKEERGIMKDRSSNSEASKHTSDAEIKDRYKNDENVVVEKETISEGPSKSAKNMDTKSHHQQSDENERNGELPCSKRNVACIEEIGNQHNFRGKEEMETNKEITTTQEENSSSSSDEDARPIVSVEIQKHSLSPITVQS